MLGMKYIKKYTICNIHTYIPIHRQIHLPFLLSKPALAPYPPSDFGYFEWGGRIDSVTLAHSKIFLCDVHININMCILYKCILIYLSIYIYLYICTYIRIHRNTYGGGQTDSVILSHWKINLHIIYINVYHIQIIYKHMYTYRKDRMNSTILAHLQI